MSNLNYLIVMPKITKDINEWYTLPLGIMYISSYMKNSGFNVFTINLNHKEGELEDILKNEVEKNDINVVLTGGLSGQYVAIKDIVDAINKIDNNIITLVGGGIVTSNPEVAMKALENCDFGIIGEGELTVVDLCSSIEKGKKFEDVNGIIFKKNDKYIITERRVEISNLDSIPFPDYEGFELEKVLDTFSDLNGVCQKGVITMSAGRSCPFKCTFCFHSSGEKYRQRSLNSFFKELDWLIEKYEIKFIYVADELFSYSEDRVAEFCERITRYNIKWMINLRVTDVTEKMVKLLKENNCIAISFGLESADNKILTSMKKFTTIEQIEKALKIVNDYKLRIVGNFIFGDIEETIETAKNTLNWWKENIRYGINLVFVRSYPGTEIYKYAVDKGLIKDEIMYLKEGCPVLNISKMNNEERFWLADQINKSLQLEKEPKDIVLENIDFNKNIVSFSCKCEFCNTTNYINDLPLFIMHRLNCVRCARRYKVPVFEDIKNSIEINTQKILDKYGKVAFWGMDTYFLEIVKESSIIIKNDKIFFIDMSEMKQCSEFNGKKVFNPNILNEENINCVIVAVPRFYASVEKNINDTRKCEIINILSLISYNSN